MQGLEFLHVPLYLHSLKFPSSDKIITHPSQSQVAVTSFVPTALNCPLCCYSYKLVSRLTTLNMIRLHFMGNNNSEPAKSLAIVSDHLTTFTYIFFSFSPTHTYSHTQTHSQHIELYLNMNSRHEIY